jgi:hypothetical protein
MQPDNTTRDILQEVYGKLEEPDGLAGLVRLRSHGPRLQDQVRASHGSRAVPTPIPQLPAGCIRWGYFCIVHGLTTVDGYT